MASATDLGVLQRAVEAEIRSLVAEPLKGVEVDSICMQSCVEGAVGSTEGKGSGVGSEAPAVYGPLPAHERGPVPPVLRVVCRVYACGSSPYSGRGFPLELLLPKEFPLLPPRVRFQGVFYHSQVTS